MAPRGGKKGGALELAPLAATGVLLAAHKLYKDMMASESAKKKGGASKKIRGGTDAEELKSAVITVLGTYSPEEIQALASQAVAKQAEVPAVAPAPAPAAEAEAEAPAMASEEPVAAAVEDAEAAAAEEFVGEEPAAAAEPAAAPVDGSTVGGKRGKKAKRHGGFAPIMAEEASAQTMAGGKKKSKRGGSAVMAVAPETMMPEMTGGKKKRGGSAAMAVAPEMMTPEMVGGKKTKKRGGAYAEVGADTMLLPAIPVDTMAMSGGKRKSSKRGGAPGADFLMPATTTPMVPEMAGGKAKKIRKPKMGGGELSAYMSQLSKLNSELSKLM